MSILLMLVLVFGFWLTRDWYHPSIIALSIVILVPIWNFFFDRARFLTIAIAYTIAYSFLASFLPGFKFMDYWGSVYYWELVAQALRIVVVLIAFCLLCQCKFLNATTRILGILTMPFALFQIAAILLKLEIIGPSKNLSLNSTFLAMMFPFTLMLENKKLSIATFVICFIAISMAPSSIGIGALIASGAVYFGVKNKVLWIIPVGGGALSLLAFAIFGKDLFAFESRQIIWKETILFTWENFPILGGGPGSFYSYGQAIQNHISKYMEMRFITMHNDFLQAFFELGAVGLALWGLAYYEAMKKSLNSPWLMALAASILVSSFGNFPHYLILESFLIFLFFYHSNKLGEGFALEV